MGEVKAKRPPKRGAKTKGGRAIDRLTAEDRQLVLAQVNEFLQYVKLKRG